MSLQRTNQSIASRILHFCVMLFVVSSIAWGQLSSEAQAQDSAEMSAMYGRGVHAYFANRMLGAEQLFSQVVQAGSTDPRVYYFRAMARLRTGRQYEAEEDMKIGAAYEARDPGSRHSIGTALQRVQGQGRRTLERFRREGRLNRVQQRRQQSKLRYEQLEQRGPQVLRREVPMQIEPPSGPMIQQPAPTASPAPTEAVAAPVASEPPAQLTIPTTEEGDLFSDPSPEPGESADTPADPLPVPAASDSTDDLFGDPAPAEPATSESTAATEDLFGDSDPPMAEDAAVSEEAVSEPATSGDLFSDPAEEAVEEESSEETPMEPEPSEELDDLFGDPGSSEAPAESAEEDPFGDAPESADSEEEDPFGDAPVEEADDSESEAEPIEEPAESTEADDLFGSAGPKEPTAVSNLTDNDKVESSKLFGILGRVVGSTIPWKNMQLPTMNLSPNTPAAAEADSAEGIALGPVPTDQQEVTPVSAEEPVDRFAEEDVAEKDVTEEDFFGEAPADTTATEDPFDDETFEEAAPKTETDSTEPEEETTEESTDEESEEVDLDDLFGDS